MKTRVLKIDPSSVTSEAILEIARVLAVDSVIVYPTDTFYGLGANCTSRQALHRIFEIKKRPFSKGLPVLISDLEMARGLAAELPPAFHALASRFWPGPLTLVLKAASRLLPELVGPARTIGVRLPAISWLQAVIRETGVPLVTTSANISGQREIDSVEEVLLAFRGEVGLIVDGGRTAGGKPSTVIDLTGEKPILIRRGVLGKKDLEKCACGISSAGGRVST
jgi:L-threonylcarbamoyladenylate synthase